MKKQYFLRVDRLIIAITTIICMSSIVNTYIRCNSKPKTEKQKQMVYYEEKPQKISNLAIQTDVQNQETEVYTTSTFYFNSTVTSSSNVTTTSTTTSTTTVNNKKEPLPIISEEVYSTRLQRYVTNEELYYLAMITCSEAGVESFEGKVAVAATVLNRMENENFPDSIYGVIFQKEQFSSAENGSFSVKSGPIIYEELSDDMKNEIINAAIEALNDNDPTLEIGGALYFYNPDETPSEELELRKNIGESKTIGHHIFYRDWF